MRIGIASPANGLALAPCQFEIAEEHIHHPASCGAAVGRGPTTFCSPEATSLAASYPPVALIAPPFGRVDTMRSTGRSFDWLPAAKIHFLFRVGFDAESCRTKHGLHARTIRNPPIGLVVRVAMLNEV